MVNAIVIGIVLLIACAIVWYLWRSKKKGAKCIGCPYASQCKSGSCSSARKTDNGKKRH